MAVLLRDLWTGELINHFRHEGEFLSRVPGANQYVDNDAIHLAKIGVDPAVLINNTTYPINAAQRTDEDVVIHLDKFDTENTIITDDELYGLPYDKPGSVLNQHREALEEKVLEKSLHSLCISAESATTPVVMTSGSSNGEDNARKRLTRKDLTIMKRKMDLLKVPKKGRELVLCPWHIEDLLQEDEKFANQWYNRELGKIINLFGFNITESGYFPVFDSATSQKKAFGAAPNAANDLAVSVCFWAPRAVQARGSVSMYMQQAKDNPKYRQSEVGFRLYHICLPKYSTGFGAFISTKV
ncbi:MAG TPA: hypothetical protein VK172_14760 [Lentimicrobium sp.]|nr:hypothetical protein [Bacteroidales bacterium]HLO92423.1 hypothetical protein [Lentimicrobium sp.]